MSSALAIPTKRREFRIRSACSMLYRTNLVLGTALNNKIIASIITQLRKSINCISKRMKDLEKSSRVCKTFNRNS